MYLKVFSTSFNPFYATGLFLYPLKTSENQKFSDVFMGYRKRPWHEMSSRDFAKEELEILGVTALFYL